MSPEQGVRAIPFHTRDTAILSNCGWRQRSSPGRKIQPSMQFPASALLELYMGKTPLKVAFKAVRGRHIILVSGILLEHLLKMGPLPEPSGVCLETKRGTSDASNSFKLQEKGCWDYRRLVSGGLEGTETWKGPPRP